MTGLVCSSYTLVLSCNIYSLTPPLFLPCTPMLVASETDQMRQYDPPVAVFFCVHLAVAS